MSNAVFGRLLRERRRARDLTQEKLAELVGCAVVTLKKIEAGSLRPSRHVAERLADALAVPPGERVAFIAQARGAADSPLTPPEAQTEIAAETPGGRTVRGYELRERIGAGGFGVVYRALQPTVGRDVAIKVIHPQYADDVAFIRRFEVEAQLVARLEHPHIVPLYDYWREPGGAYLVMRYLRGGSLQDALRHGPWSLPAALRLLDQIGAALHAAHRQGVVHRDVKPANILLDPEGNAYLADFGIAKDLDRARVSGTQPGAVVGSPEYLSPEQLRDEPVTPQTDIYSLGLVLYELLAGVNPFAGLSTADRLHRQLHEPLPSLRARRPDLADAFDLVIARATAKRAAERYPDLPSLVADMQRRVEAEMRIYPSSDAPTVDTPPDDSPSPQAPVQLLTDAVAHAVENPYKGLRAFRSSDADTFFGREALTRRLLARLAELSVGSQHGGNQRGAERFLAVIGPSGSGKSSVVLAGLLPALRRGALPGSEHWFITEAVPGAHPLEELEAALLRVAINPPPSLLEQLRADERGLTRAIKRALPADERVELVLVIDQFEELWTLVAREDDRAHLLSSLLAALADPRSRLRLVVTLRADFYDRPLLYEGFSEYVRLRTEIVTPLTGEELRDAISKPAARVGVTVEPSLADAIVRDVAAQPGALPLVQYTLTELFERRAGATMTLSGYQEVGGVAGALAQRADALYEALDAAGKAAARQLFLRLVSPGEGNDDTRRRVLRAELMNGDTSTKDVVAVLDIYGRHRLLTFDREPHTGAPTVEVAHEALIRVWERLRGWLDESRGALVILRRLAQASGEWAQSGYDASFLATGSRLAQFEALAGADLTLSDEERRYLDASLVERERQMEAERARQAQLRESLTTSEAQRLAIEALRIVQNSGNSEVAAHLAIRSIRARYTPQGDEAIATVATLDYAHRIYNAAGINISMTPDDRYIAVGGFDPEVYMVDLASGSLQHTFTNPQQLDILNVRFSPNGRQLAASGFDGFVQLWDVASGERLVSYYGLMRPVTGLAFSADGRFLLAGGEDCLGLLWHVASGQEVQRLVGHTNAIYNVAYAQDGTFVATASLDGTARLWDVNTGQERSLLSGHSGTVAGIDIASDGRTIVTSGKDGTVRLWDAASGAELQRCIGHAGMVQRVVFSPDGMLVASCGDDGTVLLWDSNTGREVRRLVGHTAFAFATSFTSDSKRLISTSGDGTSRLWSIIQKPYLCSFKGNVAAIAPNGQYVATGADDGRAHLWDMQTGELVQTFLGHESEVSSVGFTPDGARLITGSSDRTARVWDVGTGQQLLILQGHAANVHPLVASFDGRLLLSGSDDHTACIWDAQTGALKHTLRGHTDQVFDAAFSSNAQLVATASVDGPTLLWDVATGAQIGAVPHRAASVAFLPGRSALVTGGWGDNIRLWDVASGAQLAEFVGHTSTIWALRASPDGRWLLSASGDRTARLWDLETGKEVRRFTGHRAGVFSVDFSPDGRHALTGSSDGTSRLWDIDYNTTVAYLCGRLLRDLDDAERAQYGITDNTATCSGPGDS